MPISTYFQFTAWYFSSPTLPEPCFRFSKKKLLGFVGGEQGFETLILIFFSIFNSTSIAAQYTNSQDSRVINASQLLCHHFGTQGFPGGSHGKASPCNVGDPGSIPGLGRSPGEGNGYPLQYSCLENSMDRGAWQATVHGVTKSWTRLSDLTFFPFFWDPVLLELVHLAIFH